MTPEQQLQALVDRYTPAIAALARAVRKRLHAQLPPAFEMVYDNYNALVIGYSPTAKTSNAVLSIALYPAWVRLFFLYGAGLPDPDGLLQGNGKRVRSLVLADAAQIDSPPVRTLIAQAVARAPVPFGQAKSMSLSVRAISANLRPRRAPPGSASSKPVTRAAAAERPPGRPARTRAARKVVA
jgi:hypothetical protein